jgi:hypothetical protein
MDFHCLTVSATAHSIPNSNITSWSVDVAHNGVLVHKGIELSDPFSIEQEADCRWYLERYATESPFEVEKANLIAEQLKRYGPKLFNRLCLSEIVDRWTEAEGSDSRKVPRLDIEVMENVHKPGFSQDSIHRLHWELLEAPSLWPELVEQVVVSRRAVANDNAEHGVTTLHSMPAKSGKDGQTSIFNILLVLARGTEGDAAAYQDADPSLTSSALFAIQRQLEVSGSHYRLHIEIVRPGTLDAFRNHLQSSRRKYGEGYFHLVHFDLHGRVAKRTG